MSGRWGRATAGALRHRQPEGPDNRYAQPKPPPHFPAPQQDGWPGNSIRTVTIIYAGAIRVDSGIAARGARVSERRGRQGLGIPRASPRLFGQWARCVTCWAGIGYYSGAKVAVFLYKVSGVNVGNSGTDRSGAH